MTCSKVETHSTVTLAAQKGSYNSNKHDSRNDELIGSTTLEFNYHFSNYKDGKMQPPNCSLVTRRMMAVFAVENYSGKDDYKMEIVTDAKIFRDVKLGKNYHLAASDQDKEIHHLYKNGVGRVI